MRTLKTTLLIFTLLLLMSCDPVQLRRDQQNGGAVSNALNEDSLFTTIDSNSQDGEGFSHCKVAPTLSATQLGTIQACQNTADPSNIRIQLGEGSQAESTCVIPIFQGQSGSVPLTTFSSSAQGCFPHESNKVMVGSLTGDDPQYFGTSPNGVIVIKQAQVNSFYECADGINRYLYNPSNCCTQTVSPNCQGIKSASQCQQEAHRYRTATCIQFKNMHKNIRYLVYPF